MGAWTFLALAIALEIAATVCLKLSDGFARWQWGVVSLFLYSACFWAMAPAIKVIPIGVAYAIWAGVGIVAVAVIGALAFGQKLGALQFFFTAMVLIGAVGLRLTVPEEKPPGASGADAATLQGRSE